MQRIQWMANVVNPAITAQANSLANGKVQASVEVDDYDNVEHQAEYSESVRPGRSRFRSLGELKGARQAQQSVQSAIQ